MTGDVTPAPEISPLIRKFEKRCETRECQGRFLGTSEDKGCVSMPDSGALCTGNRLPVKFCDISS